METFHKLVETAESFYDLFLLIPDDVKNYHLKPKLDNITILILQHVLFGKEITNLTNSYLLEVATYSYSFIDYFVVNHNIDHDSMAIFAAEVNNLNYLTRLYGIKPNTKEKHLSSLFRAATKGNAIDVLQYLHKYNPRCNNIYITYTAASTGAFDALKWLREHGYKLSVFCTKAAANSRNYTMLRWCIENDCPFNNTLISSLCSAGTKEAIAILDLLYKNNAEFTQYSCGKLSVSGNIEAMEWGERNGLLSEFNYYHAVENGHQHIVEFLYDYDKRTNWSLDGMNDTMICEKAARCCNLQLVRWLHEKGYPWDEGIFADVVRSGDIEFFDYLLEQGFTLNYECYLVVPLVTKNTCDVLDWLISHNCPLPPPEERSSCYLTILPLIDVLINSKSTVELDDYKNFEQALNWFQEHDFVFTADVCEDISMLIMNYCFITSVLLVRPECKDLACRVISWIREHCPCDKNFYDNILIEDRDKRVSYYNSDSDSEGY